MVNCTCCCNGCTVRRQNTIQNGFPKQLLVATSVVVIITMCLIPAEARSIDEVRMRHDKRELAHPKDARPRLLEAFVEPRRHAHRKQTHINLLRLSKDPTDTSRSRRSESAERFKNATKEILRKFRNTRRFFNQDKKVFNETRQYRNGMPSWLPAKNFVDIYFYNYRSSRRGATITEKKFNFQIPKLYKMLKEYLDIFTLLLDVEVEYPDDVFIAYNKTRHDFIKRTLHNLRGTIEQIKENMATVNMRVPILTRHKNLNTLGLRVNANQCIKNDYLAVRGYGNMLNHWNLEFKCKKNNKEKPDEHCIAFDKEMRKRRDSRELKPTKTSS